MKTFPLDPIDQRDLVDFVRELHRHQVRFLVVGAYAVMAHTEKLRATKDLDVYIAGDEPNLERCALALRAFGAPAHLADIAALRPAATSKFSGITFGLSPNRVDLLTSMELPFDALDSARVDFDLDGLTISAPSKDHIIALKLQALADDPKRKKDRLDIEALTGPARSRKR